MNVYFLKISGSRGPPGSGMGGGSDGWNTVGKPNIRVDRQSIDPSRLKITKVFYFIPISPSKLPAVYLWYWRDFSEDLFIMCIISSKILTSPTSSLVLVVAQIDSLAGREEALEGVPGTQWSKKKQIHQATGEISSHTVIIHICHTFNLLLFCVQMGRNWIDLALDRTSFCLQVLCT